MLVEDGLKFLSCSYPLISAMTDSERKTVFISYRRDTSSYLARAIYQDLTHHGYDVFMDVESVNSGTFDTIILKEIAARDHFVVILEPGSEKRLQERGDWVRREIERAIELERNIVPILASSFEFSHAEPYLRGKLTELPRYNGVRLHRDYFEEAMERLRSRFLNTRVAVPIASSVAEQLDISRNKTRRVAQLPAPTRKQFSAESLVNRANEKVTRGDFTGAIQDLDKAIVLDPENAAAYNNRGNVYNDLGERDQAIRDFDKAIALEPKDVIAYFNRAGAYSALDDKEKAIADLDKAISLDPEDADAYNNRGLTYRELKLLDKAIADYDQAIALDAEFAGAYYNRASAYSELGDRDQALRDYDRSIALDPENAGAYRNRGWIYTELGRPEAAIKDFDQALALDPACTAAYFGRGVAHKDAGHYIKFLKDVVEAAALDPTLANKLADK